MIGVTGTDGSGKHRPAFIWKAGLLLHHSLSDEIRDIARERGVDLSRRNAG